MSTTETPMIFTPLAAPHTTGPHTHVAARSELGTHGGRDVVCVSDVSFAYGARPALSHITLHVKEGTTLGVIGPNGGGKSTLLKLMLGSLQPDEGTVRIMDLSPKEACSKGSLVGYVPQRHTLDWKFPITVQQVVQLGLLGGKGVFGRFNADDRQRAERALESVNMQHLASQPIGELSGGQQQRAFIARALVAMPKLLFLDEPTTGIDRGAQESFAALLETVKRQYGLTIIMVTHDLRSAMATCDRVACLNRHLHYHDQPSALSKDVLFRVFQCDMDAVLDGRTEGDCCGHVH
jgi:zinc transport system ATP-binding protein